MANQVICLFPYVIKPGDKGNPVLAMKRALSRAGYGRWKVFTKVNGPQNVVLLRRFQQHHHLDVDGIYGLNTHKKLAPFYDRYGMKIMNDEFHRLQVATEPSQKMVSAALEIYNFCKMTGRGAYTQTARRMSIVRNKWRIPFARSVWLYEDCSSSVTGISWEAKIPDPNHLGYNGQGYTGSLSVNGFRVQVPTPGSLGFYGAFWPYHHVVMCVSTRGATPLVFSWGSGLPKILPWNYRSDFNHWRSGYATAK